MLCWPGWGSEAWRWCKLGVWAAQGSLEKGDALASSLNWQSPGDGQAGAFLPQRPSDWWALQPRGGPVLPPGECLACAGVRERGGHKDPSERRVRCPGCGPPASTQRFLL